MTPSTMACPDRLDRALSLLLPPAFWLGVWQLGAWMVELLSLIHISEPTRP